VSLSDLLGALGHSTPALPGAACRGLGELFDGDGLDGAKTIRAASICRFECPVFQQCREWADGRPDRTLTGVVAGRIYSTLHPSLRNHANGAEVAL
jgi:hypothetical protein